MEKETFKRLVDKYRQAAESNYKTRKTANNMTCHDTVKLVLNKSRLMDREYVAHASGVSNTNFIMWRTRSPRIDSVEAALNVLGYTLTIDKLPLEALKAYGLADDHIEHLNKLEKQFDITV